MAAERISALGRTLSDPAMYHNQLAALVWCRKLRARPLRHVYLERVNSHLDGGGTAGADDATVARSRALRGDNQIARPERSMPAVAVAVISRCFRADEMLMRRTSWQQSSTMAACRAG